MRKLMVLGFLLILLSSLATPIVSGGESENLVYRQDYTFMVKLFPNGDANITMTTVFLGPESELEKMREQILNVTNMTAEEAIKQFEESQLQYYIQTLQSSGLVLTNATLKAYNIEGTGNITIVFNAMAKGIAKYYSRGDFWEVLVDPTRGYSSISYPDTGFPYRLELQNRFIVELPPNATLLSFPRSFRRTFNTSEFVVTSYDEGNRVIVESKLNLEAGLSAEGFEWLFGDYKDFSITYRTPYKGEENYVRKAMREHVEVEVLKNGTVILTMRDEYIEPEEEVMYYKFQITKVGPENFRKSLLNYYTRMFNLLGAKVLGAGVSVYNLNNTEPLVVEARYVLENYTKFENGTYTLTLDPTMGVRERVAIRSAAEMSYNFSARIKLPKGWKFVSYPESVQKDIHGNLFQMNVTEDGSLLTINSTVFVYYGASEEDVEALLKNASSVEIKFQEGKGGWSLCGPAGILLIGLLPLLRRRK